MRISDWSSDVCSSDLRLAQRPEVGKAAGKAVPGRRWRQYVGLLCHGSSIGNVRRVQQVQFPVTLSVLAFHATGTILTAYTMRTIKRAKSGSTVAGSRRMDTETNNGRTVNTPITPAGPEARPVRYVQRYANPGSASVRTAWWPA